MFTILDKIFKQYQQIWNLRDTRLKYMPFMDSPIPMMLLVSFYLSFVGLGKKCMEHRKPMQIDRIIIVYNIIQIVVNSYVVVMTTQHIFIDNANFSFICEPANFSTDANGMHVARVGYAYFILKLFDYFDTVFFVLRKKWAQVSFLHVYHHVMISILTFLGLLYAPGGQAILFVSLNCFVHAVMYTYYLLSVCNSVKIKSNDVFKRNITRLQLIQFCVLSIHNGQVLLIPGRDCGYPKIFSLLGFTQSLLMIVLFMNFYRNAYGSEKKSQKIQ